MNLDLKVKYLLYFGSLSMEGEEEEYVNLPENIKKKSPLRKEGASVNLLSLRIDAPKNSVMGMWGGGLLQELPRSSSSQTFWEWEVRPGVGDVAHCS